jgi:hypothetical protein
MLGWPGLPLLFALLVTVYSAIGFLRPVIKQYGLYLWG